MAEIKKANGHRLEMFGASIEPRVEPDLQPRPEDLDFDLDEMLAAVFALETRVPEDAFTATGLGTERFGNAVLIGDGLLLTIGYLVTEADRVTLTGVDGHAIDGHVVGYDHETGFGLVQAHSAIEAPPVRRGTAGDVATSDNVIVAAHGGRSHAQVSRVVSKRPFAGYWEYLLEEAIFTSPPHPLWSGAALVDGSGALCGLGSLFVQDAAPGDTALPGNMFVPIDILEPILEGLQRHGRSPRPPQPWLGMYASEAENTLVVVGMADAGPASRAGIRVGDLILGVSKQPVSSLMEFLRSVRRCGQAGTTINLQLYRDGALVDIDVRSANRYDFLKVPRAH